MSYKRKKEYNDFKSNDLKAIELRLKKIDELRTNSRKNRTVQE